MEHVLDPAAAFAEVARVLRPGGAHVFTVPYWPNRPTRVRARLGADGIDYLAEAQYHANPVDPKGALVATDRGPEMIGIITESSGLDTRIVDDDDRSQGLEGTYKEVFVTVKA
jgi:hypothetical protein